MRPDSRSAPRTILLTSILLGVAAILGWFIWGRPGQSTAIDPSGIPEPPGVDNAAEPLAHEDISGLPRQPAPLAEVRPRGVESSAGSDAGTVQFLTMIDTRPLTNFPWTFEPVRVREASAGASALHATTDADGVSQLGAGSWRVRSRDPAFMIPDDVVEVLEHQRSFVWVQRRGNLAVLVTNFRQEPIRGALVSWLPGPPIPLGTEGDSDQTTLRTSVREAITDSQGIAVVEGVALDSGTAIVMADGYKRRVCHVSGDFENPLSVVLLPTTSTSTTISVVDYISGKPVNDVLISSSLGYRLARSVGDSNSVLLPSWISPEETLLVSSRKSFPAAFRLKDLNSNVLRVRGKCQLHITVIDPAGWEGPATLVIGISATDLATAEVTPFLQAIHPVRCGTEYVLPLPQECLLEITAQSDIGGYASTELRLTSTVEASELRLVAPADALVLRLEDTDAKPIMRGWAHTTIARGNLLTCRASDGGLITIPAASLVSYLTVGASGYVPVTLEVPTAQDATHELAVTLQSELQFNLEVKSSDGHPIPGLRVDLSQQVKASGGSASVKGSWRVFQNPSTYLVTDHVGSCVVSGFTPGTILAIFTLCGAFAGDEFGRTLYEVSREFEVKDNADDIVLTIDPPRNLCVRVYEESTGLPVSGFRIVSEDGQLSTDIDGNYWCGWTPAGLAEITISVPEVGHLSVNLSNMKNGGEAEVVVPPDVPTMVRLTGLSSDDRASRAEFQVFRQESGQVSSLGTVVVAIERGECRFCLPFDGSLAIGLIGLPGVRSRVRCQPERQQWSTGGSIEFQVLRD